MKLLLILNTPPPYWGTTIMNKYLLDTLGEKQIGYIHLRIETSKKLDQLGKLHLNKLTSALHIIKGIFTQRKQYRTAYLVMSVEGFAFYRHCFFILLLFLLKKQCVLHLRALGFRNKKGLGKLLAKYIFKRSYLIQHSPFNSFDIASYKNKKVFYIPNGWKDSYPAFEKEVESRIARSSGNVNIIFLSNLIAGKGLFTVLESILNIKADPKYQGLMLKWNFVGNWQSEDVKERFYEYIRVNELEPFIGHVGPLYDDEKYAFLAGMDILAFPTFYKHETWGNVILEALMFKIPVIATNYVAIPEMVKNNETGFLVNRENPGELADKLKLLIDNPDLRKRLGTEGRNLYLRHFRLDTFKTNITRVLETIDDKQLSVTAIKQT